MESHIPDRNTSRLGAYTQLTYCFIAARCSTRTDIVFILDASRFVGQDAWDRFINILIEIVRVFDMGPERVRIGVILLEETARVVVPLGQFSDTGSLEQALRGIEYTGRFDSNIFEGLRSTGDSFRRDGRRGVSRIAVLFIFGPTTNDVDQAVLEADRLKASNTRIITVGTSNTVDENQLRRIASSQQLSLQAVNLDDLRRRQTEILPLVCPTAPQSKYLAFLWGYLASWLTLGDRCRGVGDIEFRYGAHLIF